MAPAGSLSEYNRKRDFAKTAEPAGKKGKSTSGNRFIVQKHAASHLHWDFRLEVDGVLKSWAVTKGPSPDPDIKRLAVRTEDHPLAYAEFEGTIPKGEYGGGTVMLWDRGTWAPVAGKSADDLAKGHLHFSLDGQRMHGEWLLIRLRKKAGEKRENWLLRKIDDRYAEEGDALAERELTSVLTGRTMADIAADKGGQHSLQGKKGASFTRTMSKAASHNADQHQKTSRRYPAKLPPFRRPQLATLVEHVPSGSDWMHEIKFDGYRALVAASDTQVTIYTRSGLDWTDRFDDLPEAFRGLHLPPCLIDGEIIARDSQGNPNFSLLQQALQADSESAQNLLEFYAFDLLELEGRDLTRLSNVERKRHLELLLAEASGPIHIADHIVGAGEKLLAAMCKAGQEGIISKKMAAPYQHRRTQNWLKIKCSRRQEFVIIGWKSSAVKGRAFASLLLAQHENGGLVYKGNVGSGFSQDTLDDLTQKLARLTRPTPPAKVNKALSRGVTWVAPKLVAEVDFAEFTAEGKVRHATFLGLRSDKQARNVRLEKPVELSPETADTIAITHAERVIFPDIHKTKGDLAHYYERVGPVMLPLMAQRPVSLVRCPEGVAGPCFFQKHESGGFRPFVKHIAIREKGGGTEDYLFVDDIAGILTCVQMGTIEFHGWASHANDVEAPDRMVFDLDPDKGLDFEDVKKAARDIRDHLADIGLVSFAMLSGGKGIHVVVPLLPGHSWDEHKDFSKRFAEALSTAEPDRFIATMSKAKRKGRIFIDWLRNQRGSTSVAPYSARARPGAPVAAPIAWNELKTISNAHAFSIRDAAKLIKRAAGKSLHGWGMANQKLPDL